MKAVISQTIFTAMATTHGGERSGCGPITTPTAGRRRPRNARVREIRKAFAFHLAGDQHLPAVVHYGIDEPPRRPGGLRRPGGERRLSALVGTERRRSGRGRRPATDLTGDFRDSFGNPMTVLAVKNGAVKPRQGGVLEALDDKASGLGIVRSTSRTARSRSSAGRILADVDQEGHAVPRLAGDNQPAHDRWAGLKACATDESERTSSCSRARACSARSSSAALPATARAQSSTATLSGTVADGNAAALPGTSIAVVNVETGQRREVDLHERRDVYDPAAPAGPLHGDRAAV